MKEYSEETEIYKYIDRYKYIYICVYINIFWMIGLKILKGNQ